MTPNQHKLVKAFSFDYLIEKNPKVDFLSNDPT